MLRVALAVVAVAGAVAVVLARARGAAVSSPPPLLSAAARLPVIGGLPGRGVAVMRIDSAGARRDLGRRSTRYVARDAAAAAGIAAGLARALTAAGYTETNVGFAPGRAEDGTVTAYMRAGTPSVLVSRIGAVVVAGPTGQ